MNACVRKILIVSLSLQCFMPAESHAELSLLKVLKEKTQKKKLEHQWHEVNLMREVPLSTDNYPLPEHFAAAGELFLEMRRIPSNNWLAKMEAIRRGYTSLPESERELFIELIKSQYQSDPENMEYVLFQGYTQLTYKQNKLALRLVKLADERLHNEISAFTYALSLADLDIREGKRSDEFSEKKMKAIWSLVDATHRNHGTQNNGLSESIARAVYQLSSSSVYRESLAQANIDTGLRAPASKN